jgi:NADH:ubiquinone reductase (H+-translocating)
VMTRELATLSADMGLNAAIDEFQNHPHSTYPVLDSDGQVLGLLRRATAYEWLKNHGLDCDHKIRELPLARPFKVKPDAAMPTIVEEFMHEGATKALVMDEHDKLVGMITVFDLLRG